MRGLVLLLLVGAAGCCRRADGSAQGAVASDRAPEPAAQAVPLDAGAAPAASEESGASGARYLVRANKVRCIQAPCMSLDAAPLDGGEVQRISDLDLSALGLTQEEVDQAMAQVHSGPGLQVEGSIVERPARTGRGGLARVLVASRLLP